MKDLLRKNSILILLGTGGVGKTTVAAALGLVAASRLNTALLTVDPSKRLREALGLKRLGGRPLRLGPGHLRRARIEPGLRLSAMVLDAERVWDTMVERFAPNPETRRRIVENPFYQSLTRHFTGAEAFAALQQIYDLHHSARFDIEIVDTPPAAHAFEFLEAPAHLTRLLDSRAARWLWTPSISAGQIAVKLASTAARFVLNEVERFAGGHVLATIADFFGAASETVDAIVDRLRKTEALLRSPGVRFVLVTTANEDRLARARELVDEIAAEGLRLEAIVINRFLDERTWTESRTGARNGLAHLREIGGLSESVGTESRGGRDPGGVVKWLEGHRERTLDEILRAARFARGLPPSVRLFTVPDLKLGVNDLGSLARVARSISVAGAGLESLARAAAGLRGKAPRTRRRHRRKRGS